MVQNKVMVFMTLCSLSLSLSFAMSLALHTNAFRGASPQLLGECLIFSVLCPLLTLSGFVAPPVSTELAVYVTGLSCCSLKPTVPAEMSPEEVHGGRAQHAAQPL